MPKVISATEAANKFGGMLDEVSRGVSMFVVTKMGKASAVVLGMDQFRKLTEGAEIAHEQADPAFQVLLKEAWEDVDLDRTISLDELDEEFDFRDKRSYAP